jgi:hypothetical protein
MAIKTVTYLPDVTYNADIHKYISRIIGSELAAISRPCYLPKLIRYQEDLKSTLHISDEDLIKFKNKNISLDYGPLKAFSDKYTLLLMASILYFCRNNQFEAAKLFFDFLALKQYYNTIHKHFKFCNEDIFKLALDGVSHRHLFKSKGSISAAISFLSTEVFNKHRKELCSPIITDLKLLAIFYELRQRIAQSVRSFAQLYYKLSAEKHGPAAAKDEAFEDRLAMVADKVSSMICTYGNVDERVLALAVAKSGIRREIGKLIVSEISSPDHRQQVKFLITLFNHILPLKNICVESSRMSMLRRIERKELVANRYVVRDEMVGIARSIKSAYAIRTIPDAQISIFLGHYFTLYLQSRIC